MELSFVQCSINKSLAYVSLITCIFDNVPEIFFEAHVILLLANSVHSVHRCALRGQASALAYKAPALCGSDSKVSKLAFPLFPEVVATPTASTTPQAVQSCIEGILLGGLMMRKAYLLVRSRCNFCSVYRSFFCFCLLDLLCMPFLLLYLLVRSRCKILLRHLPFLLLCLLVLASSKICFA